MKRRALIVEDNHTEAKLFMKKIIAELHFEVDVAYSLEEAKTFIARESYFVALIDINLPDAPDGEIVDLMCDAHMPSVVLSGIIDNEFRKKMMEKPIIDYVRKGRIRDIDNAIATIRRLRDNLDHKVLVVDDSPFMLKYLSRLLRMVNIPNVTVESAAEALDVLSHDRSFSLVLADYEMPEMNGVEMAIEIRNLYPKEELSIIAISSSEDEEVSAMFLKNGATDFIKKPFSKEEFICRIHTALEQLENTQKLLHYATRDFMTGLHNRRYFFEKTEPRFGTLESGSEKFCVAMIDIDHFKSINDTYGHDAGDDAIIHVAELIQTNISAKDMLARFGGEEFCIVLNSIEPDAAKRVCERIRKAIETEPLLLADKVSLKMTVSIGLNAFPENSKTLDQAIAVADRKLYEAKNGGRNLVAS
jgi:diguanylate cyclase (GGDEF)-like protein